MKAKQSIDLSVLRMLPNEIGEYVLVPSVALMYVKEIPLALTVLKLTFPWKLETSMPLGAARLASVLFKGEAEATQREVRRITNELGFISIVLETV